MPLEVAKGIRNKPWFARCSGARQFFWRRAQLFFGGNEGKTDASKEEQKRDKLMDQIALRSVELDNEGKQAVLFMIKTILKSKKRKPFDRDEDR